jgi:hypothetical protein
MLRQMLNLAEASALARVGQEKLDELLSEPVVAPSGQVQTRRSEGEKAAIREMLSGFGGPLS